MIFDLEAKSIYTFKGIVCYWMNKNKTKQNKNYNYKKTIPYDSFK